MLSHAAHRKAAVTITQSRSKLVLLFVPGSLFMLGLSGLGMYAAIILALEGRANLILMAAMIYAVCGSLVVMWAGVMSFIRPAQIETTPDGFTVRYLYKDRFWRWRDVQNFRRHGSPHGGAVAIAFDYKDGGTNKVAMLPRNWPISTSKVIALLEAEHALNACA